MCLIACSPKGLMVDRSILAYAYNKNPDGIGIMSINGIEKYMGKKALKRARRYIETYLVPDNTPYAVHFRWATHGNVQMSNTHPYEAPTGNHWVMHNGIISLTTAESTAEESDTAVFVRKYMTDVPGFDEIEYFNKLARTIGYGNKLCIMDSNGKFMLVNDDAGTWIDGIWFSNTYSLPANKIPHKEYAYGGTSDFYNWRGKGTEYIPREIWDREERKMVPNPAYKAADGVKSVLDMCTGKFERTADIATRTIPLLPSSQRWNHEDRRSYYESLEAGLTPQEAEYYNDRGVEYAAKEIGEQAALNKTLDELEAAAVRQAEAIEKETADIGGDFAPEEDREDQNKFRTYLKAVAAGIYSS